MDPSELLALASPIVSRRTRRTGWTTADREDLLQDVLAKYLATWRDGSQPDNPAAWIETVTDRAITDRQRAAARHRTDLFDEGADDPVSMAIAGLATSGRTVSLETVSAELLRTIFGLIPAEDRRLLRARYVQGFSAADLSESMGITVAAVDQRTTRAKQRLREALAARPDLVAELRSPHPRIY